MDTNSTSVLNAVVQVLRSELELSDRQCYLSIMPRLAPRILRGGKAVITVAPGRSQFPVPEQGTQQCVEEWFVTITIFTRVDLDPVDHAEAVLSDAERGLLGWKERILQTLVGRALFDEQNNPLLRDPLEAQFVTEVQFDPDKRVAWIELDFVARFDHAL